MDTILCQPGARKAGTSQRGLAAIGLALMLGWTAPAMANCQLPARAQHWQRDIARISAQLGLSPALVNAVIERESRFNAKALGPRTRQGERPVGLMQILPSTARRLGFDPRVPRANLLGGMRYLASLIDAAGGDAELALQRYSGGSKTYAERVLARAKTCSEP